MSKLFVSGLISCSLFAVACESVDSEDVMTSGVHANISATADGDGQTLVKAALRVGGATSNTYLDIMGDDKLTASMANESKQMDRKTLLGAVWYETRFAEDASNTEFKVSLERTVSESAPDTTMTMPQPFSITAPTDTPEFSRSEDDIVITWEPSDSPDEMRIWVDDTIDGSRNCVRAFAKTLAGDTGSYTIAAGTIKGRENQQDQTCATTITVIRRRTGSLDAAYGEGGEAFARHYRTVQITSAP